MKTILSATLVLCSVCVAPCQINYFTLAATGDQETPPNSSPAAAGGIAAFDASANTISVSSFFAGLSSPATASHVHVGAPGVPGPVIVSFVPFTPAATAGSIVGGPLPFPVADIPALSAGNTYFNIHDAVFPGGEIRGQLTPPGPGPSGAVGGGIAAFNPSANTISISMFFAGLSSPATASHIHVGAPGVSGPVIDSFVPFTPTATSGSIVGGPLPFPAVDIPDLLAGDTYFNIHDAVFPGGEIRGQLVPAGPSTGGIELFTLALTAAQELPGTPSVPDASSTLGLLGVALFGLSSLCEAFRLRHPMAR